jgi:hypothetical protein
MTIKTYSDLSILKTIQDRFEYLKLGGLVGKETFGFDRYLNQSFYRSREWRSIRDHVIVRDNGCDLGVQGYEIHDSILVHHINPLTSDDIVNSEEWLLDPEFLITTTQATHNAIHYGDRSLLPLEVTVRRAGDTKLW